MPKPYHTPRSERDAARTADYPTARDWAEVSDELRAIAAERAAALAAGLTPLQADRLAEVSARIGERERRAAERRAMRARPENRPGRRFTREAR